MKKYWKPIVAVALILIFLLLLIKPKDEPFSKVDITSTNIVYNTSDRKYLDTIVIIGLKKLNVENTRVVIKNLDNTGVIPGYNLKAYILNKNNDYMIFIKDASRAESIEILAHELIHYKQYNDRRLYDLNTSIQWEGKSYNPSVEYEQRPWEIEAFAKSNELEKSLNNELYK